MNKYNVKPINDIYTHDCFMNSLLCAAKSFQLNYDLLTLHKSYFYIFSDMKFRVSSAEIFQISELSSAIGMSLTRERDDRNNWKEKYENYFLDGKMIIAAVDDFYNPLRKDVYRKKHLPHYILVYGMKSECENLLVIESQYRATVSYNNMKLSFDDFEKCHFAIKEESICISKKSRKEILGCHKKLFLTKCIDLTLKSIDGMLKFLDYLSSHQIKDKEGWLDDLNDVCNDTKVELYVFKNVIFIDDVSYITEKIYTIWYFLRAKTYSLLLRKQYKDLEKKISSYVKKILELEKRKYNLLCSYCFRNSL